MVQRWKLLGWLPQASVLVFLGARALGHLPTSVVGLSAAQSSAVVFSDRKCDGTGSSTGISVAFDSSRLWPVLQPGLFHFLAAISYNGRINFL